MDASANKSFVGAERSAGNSPNDAQWHTIRCPLRFAKDSRLSRIYRIAVSASGNQDIKNTHRFRLEL
jgi:hypothetical protein